MITKFKLFEQYNEDVILYRGDVNKVEKFDPNYFYPMHYLVSVYI
jgi:hypothetical protein